MSQQRFHAPDASLPSTGSARAFVPLLQRYYQGTATSCRPSRRASFPSHGRYHGITHVSLPPPLRATASGLGLFTRSPRPGMLPWRHQDLPSFWGASIPVCTCSPTPDGQRFLTNSRNRRVAPAIETTEAPTTTTFRGSIAWLSGSPPTHHALVSRNVQGWLPGAGQALPDGLSPARLLQKVSNFTSCVLSSFSSLLGTIQSVAPTSDFRLLISPCSEPRPHSIPQCLSVVNTCNEKPVQNVAKSFAGRDLRRRVMFARTCMKFTRKRHPSP